MRWDGQSLSISSMIGVSRAVAVKVIVSLFLVSNIPLCDAGRIVYLCSLPRRLSRKYPQTNASAREIDYTCMAHGI